MDTGNVILALCIFLFVLYKYGAIRNNYWKKKGIKQLNPWPFIGDNIKVLLRSADALENAQNMYFPFKQEKFGGIYLFRKPFLSVADPDLLKQILVKDSEYFINRHDWNSGDTLMSKNLVSLRDEKWRRMRIVMTTVFTSAKMKDMFGFMDKCAQQSVEFLDRKLAEKDVVEVDLRDFFSRYGTDVIATTAFGIEVDSFKNPNNEFYRSGFEIRKLFSGLGFLKFMLMMIFPSISKSLNISFFSEECKNFFISLVKQNIKEREEKKIVRKDVINILMEARNGKGIAENGDVENAKLPNLTDEDIAAQAIIFFFAGFETISTLLGFLTYELVINPDIQTKLQEEIDEVLEKENGMTYDGIMRQMTYLHMVVNETLRKWPPATITDREVSRPYVLPKTETTPEIHLNKNEKIIIPIAGFHYDPEYFPDPHKFDPERFRDEKSNVKPYTFLAFGEGPRHCIGMRYALMEAKTILVQLLRKFTIVPTQSTPIPIKITKKKGFMLDVDEGFKFGLKPRK